MENLRPEEGDAAGRRGWWAVAELTDPAGGGGGRADLAKEGLRVWVTHRGAAGGVHERGARGAHS